MKLYRTTYSAASSEPFSSVKPKHVWHGSAVEARKARVALKAENGQSDPSTEMHEIPSVKAGLIGFLNALAI